MSSWYHAHQATVGFSLVNVLLALGMFSAMNAGMISLAGAGFMAGGAYAAGVTASKFGVGYTATLLIGMATGATLAAAITLPLIRLRSHYFAIATLAFSLVVSAILVKWHWISGGSIGFVAVPLRTSVEDLAIAAVGVAIVLQFVHRSETGRVLRAIRDDEYVAAISGVRIRRYKFFALTFSGLVSGLAGAMYAQNLGVLQPSDFREDRAFAILSFTVLGGAWHWIGSALGAVVLTWLPEYLRVFSRYRDALTGVVLLVVIFLTPRGLLYPLQRLWPRVLGRRRRRFGSRRARLRRGGGYEAAKAPRRREMPGNVEVLGVRQITKTYGGVRALDDVSVDLQGCGGIYGLIGPNGSGKTTLLNVVNGFARPDTGAVRIAGADVTSRGPIVTARAGVSRSFQEPRVLPEITVADNILIGCHLLRRAGTIEAVLPLFRSRREDREARRRVDEALEEFGLNELADEDAGSLSFGQRRLVELARISVSDPLLVILDEPTSGVNPVLIEVIANHVRARSRERKTTYLIAEHNMPFVMDLCDSVVVLEGGRVLMHDLPQVVQNDERVLDAYLGAAV